VGGKGSGICEVAPGDVLPESDLDDAFGPDGLAVL